MPKNYGLIIEPIQPEDFVLGSDRSLSTKFAGRTPINPSGDWRPFAPVGELQAPEYETNACASFGTLNALETLKRFVFKDEPNFSDRFVAKGSGTDPRRGNTPKAPAEFIRKNWSVFEFEYPSSAAKSVEDYYAELPQSLRTLAIGRGAEWDFGYEYVNGNKQALRTALTFSPTGISVPAWFKDEATGEYYRPQGAQDNHWVAALHMDEQGRITILDTYEPFIKVMRADFTPLVAIGYYLNRQVKEEGAWARFLAWLHKLVFTQENDPKLLEETPAAPAPVTPTVPQREEPKYKWNTKEAAKASCRAICKEEGLTLEQTNTLVATVQGESQFNTQAVNRNIAKDGKTVLSTDWGICQINDYYHIGQGKSFPSVTFVLSNPDACIRWMCKQWKLGNRNWWIAYKNGSYKKYLETSA